MGEGADRVRAIEQAAVDLCLAPERPQARLQQLGDARIWSLYREMVRNRLRGELKIALKRAHQDAGEPAFERAFVHHLAEAPPRSRFFHGIVGDFARSAAPFLREQTDVPAHVGDLLEYEAAVWAVGDLDDRAPATELEEFSFEGRPVLSHATRLLQLQYAVHRKREGASPYERGEVRLCVHRRPEDRRARTWTLNPITYDLLRCFEAGEATVTEAVQRTATARKVAIDQPFLDGLCTVLADFIERGVILGCCAP